MRLLLISLAFSAAAAAQSVTVLLRPAAQNAAAAIIAETAVTESARRRGLSGRQHMDDNHGMLFEFRPPEPGVCMWMKNTAIPLAALFADRRGVIVTAALMQPHTETPHCAPRGTEIKHVLEITQRRFKSLPPPVYLVFPGEN